MEAHSRFPKNELFADPILKTGAMFAKDTDPNKINVGIGAYRDENGKPVIMRCVQAAERYIIDHPTEFLKEYPPMMGNPEFMRLAAELLFGSDHPVIKEKRDATAHCIAGSGCLYAAFRYFTKQFPGQTVYFPNITWANHNGIWTSITDGKLPQKTYRFFDRETLGVDFKGLMEDFEAMPDGSFILMHACAHNPTGAEVTHEQWDRICELVKRKNHLVLFDAAYPGFASGNVENDLYAPRHFAAEGCEIMVAQSFSKIMGLYGERCGVLHIVHTGEPEMTEHITSDLGRITRTTWSMPPIHGGDIVRVILRDPIKRKEWDEELKEMTGRILRVRKDLVAELNRIKCPSPTKAGNWDHLIHQSGMFSFLGIRPNQCRYMISRWHIYLVESSRISVCGLNSSNIAYFAAALKDTMENCKPE